MKKDDLIVAGIDYEEGVRRFMGNEEMYQKFLKKFPLDPNFLDLQKAVADKDYERAFRCAHTLKGVAGNLSLTLFYQKMVILVEKLRKKDIDGIELLLEDLRIVYQNILAVLI